MNNQQEIELSRVVKLDDWYQKLLIRFREIELDYTRILSSLPGSDQEKLEEYISLCEELGHRRSCLAYNMGRTDKTNQILQQK